MSNIDNKYNKSTWAIHHTVWVVDKKNLKPRDLRNVLFIRCCRLGYRSRRALSAE